MVNNDDDNGFKDMTNREMISILMQEIVDVRRELKEEMKEMRNELKKEIKETGDKLAGEIQKLDRKIENLTFKVDQNQIAFMSNVEDIDKRVAVLETK